MILFIAGLFVGGTIGIFLMSILTMGKMADMETVITTLKEELPDSPVLLR